MNNDDENNPSSSPITASQWRQIVDSAVDTAIISLDLLGRVTAWNTGASQILGWDEPEMLGQPLDRIFPQGSQQLSLEIADARSKGRGGGEEGWRTRKGGTRIWAAGEVSPIREDGKLVGYVKILRDRTRQRAHEDTVREERRALEILNRAGSALALETDLHRLVQIVTDAGVALTGAQFGAFFYNVKDERGESYMLYTLSGASPEAFSKFPMPRNTAVFAPTFNGDGIVRSSDITQDPRYGKNAPRKGMPEGHLPVRSYLAVPVKSRDGSVTGGLFFGHAAEGVFGELSERGLVGLASEAAVAIDNAHLAAEAQKQIAQRTQAQSALSELNANLEREIAQRTEQLRLREDALRQSQKMEAVGQLTGGVAHDFNNILQVIVGNLELIRRLGVDDVVQVRRAADKALNGARQASSLTQRLLAFSRRQPLDPKVTDVNSLIGGISELLNRSLGETVAVETVRAAGLWRVEVDPNALESAILNLAVNARDAMVQGGRLTIETSNANLDEAYSSAHVEVRPGQYVAISVSDTGSGMGTTVKIYLPRIDRSDNEATLAQSSALLKSSGSELILVVEDEDNVRTYTVEALRELGYQVLEAHDGPSAIQLLHKESDSNFESISYLQMSCFQVG